MKQINISVKPEFKDWSMQFMDQNNYDTILSETTRVNKPDGSPLLILIKKAISEESYAKAYPALKKINSMTCNRSTASGMPAIHMKKKDGTISNYSQVPRGWDVLSAVIGYFERDPRRPYCHACKWNDENYDLFQKLFPLLVECSSHFKEQVPDRWAVQKSYVDRTHKDFVIPGTVYTTLTLNKNFRTAAHKDAGDLAAGFSNMAVFREGVFAGGNLVLPDWRIAVELDHLDLVMFDAHQFHGNTQVTPITKKGQRTSLVMYYRERMTACKSVNEELERAKNRKMGDPLYD